jgi:hypothetical protein
MERSSVMLGRTRNLLAAVAALAICAAPGTARAQEQPDPLKFETNAPVLIIYQVRADKTADWEEAWKGIRALLEKASDPELQAMSQSLSKQFRVDQDPIDAAGTKAAIYVFHVDSPSTKFSYHPQKLVYTHLKAGEEGAPTRAEADPPYIKLAGAFLNVSVWKLKKVE